LLDIFSYVTWEAISSSLQDIRFIATRIPLFSLFLSFLFSTWLVAVCLVDKNLEEQGSLAYWAPHSMYAIDS
jgi:hypothetical protein